MVSGSLKLSRKSTYHRRGDSFPFKPVAEACRRHGGHIDSAGIARRLCLWSWARGCFIQPSRCWTNWFAFTGIMKAGWKQPSTRDMERVYAVPSTVVIIVCMMYVVSVRNRYNNFICSVLDGRRHQHLLWRNYTIYLWISNSYIPLCIKSGNVDSTRQNGCKKIDIREFVLRLKWVSVKRVGVFVCMCVLGGWGGGMRVFMPDVRCGDICWVSSLSPPLSPWALILLVRTHLFSQPLSRTKSHLDMVRLLFHVY